MRVKQLGTQFPVYFIVCGLCIEVRTGNTCDIETPAVNSHPVKSERLQFQIVFVSLLNMTGEETLRVKHKQLNAVMCDSWKKKTVTLSQALPSNFFCGVFRFLSRIARNIVYKLHEIERRPKNCMTSHNDNKLQILFFVRGAIDAVTLGTSDAL